MAGANGAIVRARAVRVGEKQFGRGLVCLVVTLLIAVFSSSAFAQGMTLPGNFAVSSVGAATYSIPIALPPGTAGMAPSLSLDYNSRAGNGIVGVGWSLAGLPAIVRCPMTIAQDGARGGIAYDASDRFCLEGERLVAISGTYGGDGTEYRTEREGFSKVVSYGSAGTGPAWFKVWTKAGQILELGNTADSRIEAEGKTTARLWTVNKVSDTVGNYFSITYAEDNANGEYRPIRIDYTGNAAASVAPYSSVRFVYETRPTTDQAGLFLAGARLKTTQRLAKVQGWIGESLVSETALAYETGTPLPESRLVSVQRCDATGACLPATQFQWQAQSTFNYPSPLSTSGGSGIGSDHAISYQDMNGDGIADAVAYQLSGQTWSGYIAFGRGDGTFETPIAWNGGYGYGLPYALGFADLNGDGRMDMVLYYNNGSTWYVIGQLSKGDGTFQPTSWYGPGVGTGHSLSFDDFNGDGIADAVAYQLSGQTWSGYIAFGRGDGTFEAPIAWNGGYGYGLPYALGFADLNGDGRMDMVLYYNNGSTWYVIGQLSRGDGTFQPTSWYGPGVGTGHSLNFGDFNGDGIADAVAYQLSGQTWSGYIAFGRGDGTFETPIAWSGGYGWSLPYTLGFTDLNGDGRTDMMMYCNGSSNWYVAGLVSKGDGTFHPISWYGPAVGSDFSLTFADTNGDGASDPVAYRLSGGVLTTQTSLAPYHGRLVSQISTGLGATTAITYERVNKGAPLYTRDTGTAACEYPCVDLQVPLYVVSRVDKSNGVGGVYGTTYSYAGLKADLSGRGFLGFRQMTSTDLQSGMVETTNFLQSFPYIGMVSSSTKMLSAQTLSQGMTTFQFKNAANGTTISTPSLTSAPYRVSVAQSVTTRSDLDGTAMPTTTNTFQYDSYGNTTQVAVSNSDGHSKTTNNTFTNDTTNWLLGRLTTSSVAAQSP